VRREKWGSQEDVRQEIEVELYLFAQKYIIYLPDSSNRLLVCLKLLHIVHVGLPVLDEAIVVACDHPVVVVRPHHRSHRHCMSLKQQ